LRRQRFTGRRIRAGQKTEAIVFGIIRRIHCRIGAFFGLSSHRPTRAYIPPWSGFRCARCGATAETESELLNMREPDFVDMEARHRREKDK